MERKKKKERKEGKEGGREGRKGGREEGRKRGRKEGRKGGWERKEEEKRKGGKYFGQKMTKVYVISTSAEHIFKALSPATFKRRFVFPDQLYSETHQPNPNK